MQKIVIGVSSGVAAYKVLDLIKLLKKSGYNIFVIMTVNAIKMINPSEFEKVSGHKVYTSLFPKSFDYKKVLEKREVEHITLADSTDIFIVAPATANTIAKIACGIADDLLTTTLLATTAPVLICPSMNTHMWYNPLVQENIIKLEKLGYYFLHPESGTLACGYTGIGRLVSIEKISEEVLYIINQRNQLKGKKIIVTAGGTSEPIDAVRVITNRSSGKMGVAIAEECYRRGADVLLFRAKTSVVARCPIKEEIFETGKELSDLIKMHLKNYNVLFHCAAVSDYKPVEKIEKKLDSGDHYSLHLESTVKILSQIKKWNPKVKLVGFKAVYKESEKDLIRIGREKLKQSNSDYIIVNDIGREGIGFSVDDNEVYIISPSGLLAKVEKSPKKEIAQNIIDHIFVKREETISKIEQPNKLR